MSPLLVLNISGKIFKVKFLFCFVYLFGFLLHLAKVMAYIGNNSWKREAGPWEAIGKMRGNMERKKRHNRRYGDRKLGTKSVSCLTLMKTSPRCGFAAGDHLHLLAQYLTWSWSLAPLESVCRPAFLLLTLSIFSSSWTVGSVQSVLWFGETCKSSECIAQSSQNFGCTVQFTLLFSILKHAP